MLVEANWPRGRCTKSGPDVLGASPTIAGQAGLRTVAIVQARTTSTRFPGKVLADLAGEPLLAWVLRRASVAAVDEVVVATTANAEDDPLIAIAEREGARWFRGDEHDVLSRYVQAAREARADAVVRLTADCPMLDAEVVNRVIEALCSDPASVDYSANVIVRTFPQGLDAEALFLDVLLRAERMGRSPESREHVTWFIREERPDLFERRSVTSDDDDSDLQWSVDRPADLDRIRALFAALDLGSRPLPYKDVVAHVRSAGG
jgi:spore coat polysaccharide biosynthesis protein SpsF